MKKKFYAGIAAGVFSSLFLGMTAFAGAWQKMGNNWAYLNDNGQYACNQLLFDADNFYYIGPDSMMKTGFVLLNNRYFYFGPSGEMQAGWIYDNNNWYYISPITGTLITNTDFTDTNGKQYHINPDGTMAHYVIVNGNYYGSDGALISTAQNYSSMASTQSQYSSTPQLVTNRYTSSATTFSDSDNDDDASDSSYSDSSSSNHYYSSSGSSYTDDMYDEYADEILKLVNKERKRKKREPLELNEDLCEYANMRAEQLVDDFSHDAFNEDGELKDIVGTAWLGENIAKWPTSPADVMNSWNKSKGHHNNIINKKFTRLGVGIYNDKGTLYWVQDFAS